MHKGVLEIIISCNSTKEAEKIGKHLLKERLVACFDIIPRTKTFYFWPPGKNKITTGKGCILIAPTLPKHFGHIELAVDKLHSDKVPFIGSFLLEHVNKDYYNWLSLELK